MAKKHKHEEHVNHERWLVSFADMMTLLFALFVVLYAMGVTQLEKMKQVKESIQFAFHIAGDGKTKEDGVFEQKRGAGAVPDPAPLINAQEGAMKEFMKQALEEFKETTGKSIDIVQTNDTITMRAPLSRFFTAGRPSPMKPEVFTWLSRLVPGSMQFSSGIRIIIASEDVLIGENAFGKLTSGELCTKRLWTLRNAVKNSSPEVRGDLIKIEWHQQKEVSAMKGGAVTERPGTWEDRAEVILAFSNMQQEADPGQKK